MRSARAVVFANGDFNQHDCTFANVSVDDFLVCVDGGIKHCLSAGLTPDLLIGDLDSLDEAATRYIADSSLECIRFPPEKDASDLELALQTLIDRPVNEVVLLGASGGRTDHHLFNWQLVGSRSWPFAVRVIDDYVDAQLVDSSRPFDVAAIPGQLFSVIPLVGCATGVNVSGAKYPLSNAELNPGSTIGLSNAITEPHLQVSVEEGIVLVMQVRAEIS